MLVSELVPYPGEKKPSYSLANSDAVSSGEAFAATVRREISQDIVEEWIALGLYPLCSLTCFDEFVEVDGYQRPVLVRQRPTNFSNDRMFVRFMEEKAATICEKITDKEAESKLAAVGGRRRLNRAFDIMGVEYDDRLLLDESESRPSAVLAVPATGSFGAGPQIRTQRGSKRKCSEVADVQLGRLVVKAGKKSRKFSLDDDYAYAGYGDDQQVSGFGGHFGAFFVVFIFLAVLLCAFLFLKVSSGVMSTFRLHCRGHRLLWKWLP